MTEQQLLDFLKSNRLFAGLSDAQLQIIVKELRETPVESGEFVITEFEVSSDIYLIKEGAVEVCRFDAESRQHLHVAELTAGAVIGEVSMIDRSPRSASVRATQPSILLALSIETLRQHPAIHAIIVQNIANQLSQRIRTTNDAVVETLKHELAHTKMIAAMSKFIINTLALLSCYIIIIQILAMFRSEAISSTAFTVPILIFLAVPMLYMMKHSGYPMSLYGLTTKHLKKSLQESFLFSLPILFFVVLYKWLLITYSAAFANRHLFDLTLDLFSANGTTPPAWLGAVLILFYLLFVPVQELLVRGSLQSSFQIMLVGRHKILLSILLSNLLFTVMHSHISLAFGLVAFIPGLFWGWLYSRHHNLIGVTLSHLILGAWAIFIVGIF